VGKRPREEDDQGKGETKRRPSPEDDRLEKSIRRYCYARRTALDQLSEASASLSPTHRRHGGTAVGGLAATGGASSDEGGEEQDLCDRFEQFSNEELEDVMFRLKDDLTRLRTMHSTADN